MFRRNPHHLAALAVYSDAITRLTLGHMPVSASKPSTSEYLAFSSFYVRTKGPVNECLSARPAPSSIQDPSGNV